jgi:hypothetical protein
MSKSYATGVNEFVVRILPAETVIFPVLAVLVDLPNVKVGTVEESPTTSLLKLAPPANDVPTESNVTAPEVFARMPPLPLKL